MSGLTMPGNLDSFSKPIPEFTELKSGQEVVFSRAAQAWFPDPPLYPSPGGTKAVLSDLFPARAVLLRPVKFETKLGMRSRDIDFEITEQWEAPKP